jgi:hypothetical protein
LNHINLNSDGVANSVDITNTLADFATGKPEQTCISSPTGTSLSSLKYVSKSGHFIRIQPRLSAILADRIEPQRRI